MIEKIETGDRLSPSLPSQDDWNNVERDIKYQSIILANCCLLHPVLLYGITKTSLFKYTEKFYHQKMEILR